MIHILRFGDEAQRMNKNNRHDKSNHKNYCDMCTCGFDEFVVTIGIG